MDWTPDELARLRELWAEGLSFSAIGKLMGCSKNAISGKAHRLNLPMRGNPFVQASERPSSRKPIQKDGRPTAAVRRKIIQQNQRVELATIRLPEVAGIVPRDRPTCCYIVGDIRRGGKKCGAPLFRRGYCEVHARACFAIYNRPSEASA